MRSDMDHSFTCKLHHACLYSPAAEHQRPLAGTHFTVPRRVEGWVDLCGWLHTEIKCRPGSRTRTVTHPSTNRAQRRLTSLIKTNDVTTTPSRHTCRVCTCLSVCVCLWCWHAAIKMESVVRMFLAKKLLARRKRAAFVICRWMTINVSSCHQNVILFAVDNTHIVLTRCETGSHLSPINNFKHGDGVFEYIYVFAGVGM